MNFYLSFYNLRNNIKNNELFFSVKMHSEKRKIND